MRPWSVRYDPTMSEYRVSPLSQYVADDLMRQASSITDAWLRGLATLSQDGAPPLLPSEELRDHIPQLIRVVAEFIRLPLESVRSDIIDVLKIHADLRRTQGYDVRQLLLEFEVLSEVAFRTFSDSIRNYPKQADPGEVADLAGRLREGLTEITSDAVGMFREAELSKRRELASRLAAFARAIAHELKNPLGAAKAGTKMLQEPGVVVTPAERDRFAQLILRNLARMDDLIDDIRALALVEDVDVRERSVPLSTVIDNVLDEVRERAGEKGVRVEANRPLPDAEVDATRVEIPLNNLVVNAVKYADPAKSDRWVVVKCERENNSWIISVADNGLGIPGGLQGQVFQNGFRAHPEAAEGTGFGLAIAHEIVTARGGRIWFESEEGRGTTFYFTVPQLNRASLPGVSQRH